MGPPLDLGYSGGSSPSAAMPHSTEAEREVLAAVFIDGGAFDLINEHVTSSDFYHERHQLVFESMRRVQERNGSVDFVTLNQELKDAGHWEKSGGAQTLATLLDRAGTTANLAHYCQIVSQKATLRNMIDAARNIETEGFSTIENVADYLEKAEASVFSVLEGRYQTDLRPVRDVVVEAITEIQQTYESDESITGVGTGFRDLDKLTHGLQRGDLIVLAARPAMGKTSLALNIAQNAAVQHKKSVAVFSLEMPSNQLAMRLLAARARVDLSSLRGGYLANDDWERLAAASEDLSHAQLFIDDTPGASVTSIRAKCRRLHRKQGLDLILIDYLQLMSGNPGTERSREQEISGISRSLKHLAKELHVPVMALSQLNRGVESRTDKRPLMSDLRESGAIEQDADIIVFIYRDEVYNQNVDERFRGVAEIIISKHRNGPTGVVKLKFWNSHTRFDNLAMFDEH
jgi:replicative DNA helicase